MCLKHLVNSFFFYVCRCVITPGSLRGDVYLYECVSTVCIVHVQELVPCTESLEQIECPRQNNHWLFVKIQSECERETKNCGGVSGFRRSPAIIKLFLFK